MPNSDGTIEEEAFIYLVMADEKNPLKDVAFCATIDEAKSHRFSKKNRKKKIVDDKQEDGFESIISNMVKSFSDYYQVSDISSVLPRVFARSMVKEGIGKVTTEDNKVFESKAKKVFHVEEKVAYNLLETINEAMKYGQSLSVLPSAVLLSIVATFDAHLSSLAKFVLKSQPLSSLGKGKQISVGDILKFEDFDDLKSNIIEEEVYSLMFESHGSQAERIEKFFNIEIRDKFPEWGSFIEIFERRNLVAHGEGIVNSIYVKSLKRNLIELDSDFCLKFGQDVEVDRSYLQKSLDILLHFLFLTSWTIWVKKEKGDFLRAYNRANEICYDLIKMKRYDLSSRLLETFIDWSHKDIPDRSRRMMVINRANAVKLSGDESLAKTIVNSYDWSASSDDFIICVHAVKGEAKKVCELMKKFGDETVMSRNCFRDWPVFSSFFNDEIYRESFKETFGEDFDPHIVH